MGTIVEFKDYCMGFQDDDGKVYNLLDRLSFKVEEGKALGVVGESGCGKSMTSLSMMRLLPDGAVVQGGEILLEGENLLDMPVDKMRQIRGEKLAMIFQEPMTALNPVLTIGQQIGESLTLHHPEMKKQEVRKRVLQPLYGKVPERGAAGQTGRRGSSGTVLDDAAGGIRKWSQF